MNTGILQASVAKNLWLNNANITKKIDNSLGMLHGIGFTEYMVLNQLMIAPNKRLRRIDIAESIGRTASGMTRMLLPMEKIGLIEKEKNPRDARVSLVKISATGETKYEEATITLNEVSERLFNKLNQKQLTEFMQLLQLLN